MTRVRCTPEMTQNQSLPSTFAASTHLVEALMYVAAPGFTHIYYKAKPILHDGRT